MREGKKGREKRQREEGIREQGRGKARRRQRVQERWQRQGGAQQQCCRQAQGSDHSAGERGRSRADVQRDSEPLTDKELNRENDSGKKKQSWDTRKEYKEKRKKGEKREEEGGGKEEKKKMKEEKKEKRNKEREKKRKKKKKKKLQERASNEERKGLNDATRELLRSNDGRADGRRLQGDGGSEGLPWAAFDGSYAGGNAADAVVCAFNYAGPNGRDHAALSSRRQGRWGRFRSSLQGRPC